VADPQTTEEAPLTDDALDAAMELCEQATPGPWFMGDVGYARMIPRPGLVVCADDDDETTVCRVEYEREADAAFIAAARTLFPRLISEVRRGRDREAQLEDWFDSRLDEIYQGHNAALALEKAKWREVLEDVLSELDWHIHHYRKSPNDTEVIIAAARRALGGGDK
jgi:hypothetical protein